MGVGGGVFRLCVSAVRVIAVQAGILIIVLLARIGIVHHGKGGAAHRQKIQHTYVGCSVFCPQGVCVDALAQGVQLPQQVIAFLALLAARHGVFQRVAAAVGMAQHGFYAIAAPLLGQPVQRGIHPCQGVAALGLGPGVTVGGVQKHTDQHRRLCQQLDAAVALLGGAVPCGRGLRGGRGLHKGHIGLVFPLNFRHTAAQKQHSQQQCRQALVVFHSRIVTIPIRVCRRGRSG